jgi:CRP-like cAMP-binding protein
MDLNFKDVFKDFKGITEIDIKICESYFEPMNYYKNAIIEVEGKIPKHLYFVYEGYMRLFYNDDKGDEITTYIASPKNYITSFLEFIHQKKSNQNLECINDCKCYRIERSNLVKLIDTNENFKDFSLVIFEQAIATSNVRANDLATLTAESRYKKILENRPDIIHNVPIQYIASYLGIKPQSLSRIRKQIIK